MADTISESRKLTRTRLPTLGQMIREARADQQVIKRATKEALHAWLRQSERLNIARREYRLHGARFQDFARRIGIIDQTTAYQLVHLHRYRVQIVSRCAEEAAAGAKRGQPYRYPGWETALDWFHEGRNKPRGRYWLTPRALYRTLDAEFGFDFDPCPYPRPQGFDSLAISWGGSNFVNPPFSQKSEEGSAGPVAFVHKAIAEQKRGRTSVLLLPVHDYIHKLIEAGAELRPLGPVPFQDVDTGRPSPHPLSVVAFLLRGKK